MADLERRFQNMPSLSFNEIDDFIFQYDTENNLTVSQNEAVELAMVADIEAKYPETKLAISSHCLKVKDQLKSKIITKLSAEGKSYTPEMCHPVDNKIMYQQTEEELRKVNEKKERNKQSASKSRKMKKDELERIKLKNTSLKQRRENLNHEILWLKNMDFELEEILNNHQCRKQVYAVCQQDQGDGLCVVINGHPEPNDQEADIQTFMSANRVAACEPPNDQEADIQTFMSSSPVAACEPPNDQEADIQTLMSANPVAACESAGSLLEDCNNQLQELSIISRSSLDQHFDQLSQYNTFGNFSTWQSEIRSEMSEMATSVSYYSDPQSANIAPIAYADSLHVILASQSSSLFTSDSNVPSSSCGQNLVQNCNVMQESGDSDSFSRNSNNLDLLSPRPRAYLQGSSVTNNGEIPGENPEIESVPSESYLDDDFNEFTKFIDTIIENMDTGIQVETPSLSEEKINERSVNEPELMARQSEVGGKNLTQPAQTKSFLLRRAPVSTKRPYAWATEEDTTEEEQVKKEFKKSKLE